MTHSAFKRFVLFCLAALVVMTAGAAGSVFKHEDEFQISNLHTIDDDVYVLAEENLRVDGRINGDLLGLVAKNAVLNGTVTGSVNLVATTCQHQGFVSGSYRALGETIMITGRTSGSVLIGGTNLQLSQGSVVERDFTAFGQDIAIDGIVNGKVLARGGTVHITGTIQGDAQIHGSRISIVPPAVIKGNLTYTAKDSAALDISGATVLGTVTWEPPEEEEDDGILPEVILRFSSLLAAFLFGVIMIRIFRPYAEESYQQLRQRATVSLAAGFVGIIVLVGCVIVLTLSIFASIAGALLISGDLAVLGAIMLIVSILLLPIVSFAAVSGGVVFYAGKIVVALFIGGLLTGASRDRSRALSAASLLLGLVIITILYAVPYFVGWLVFVLTVLFGGGAIILGVRHCRNGQPIRASAIPHPPSEPTGGSNRPAQ